MSQIHRHNIPIYCKKLDLLKKKDDNDQPYDEGVPPDSGKAWFWFPPFGFWDQEPVMIDPTNYAITYSMTKPRLADAIVILPHGWKEPQPGNLPSPKELRMSAEIGKEYEIAHLVKSLTGNLFHEYTHTNWGAISKEPISPHNVLLSTDHPFK